jgi:hypothetical protein
MALKVKESSEPPHHQSHLHGLPDEVYYLISKSSLIEALGISRWSGEDPELIIAALEGRNEIEEVEPE